MKRGSARWAVNVIAFVLFALQALTGLVAWLLPRGGGVGSLRHLMHDAHLAAGALLVVVIAVHLALHWAYILESLKRSGLLKR